MIQEIDLALPDFLKVGKDGKNLFPGALKIKKGVKMPVVEPMRSDPAAEMIKSLTAEQREYFEKQLKDGHFMRHWLLDPSTVAMAWALKSEKEEVKREKLAALKALAAQKKAEAPPKIAKPAFGLHAIITEVKPNTRKPGTRAHSAYALMADWVKKNPNGTVAQLIEATKDSPTSYRRIDFEWDLSHGSIKSNVAASIKTLEPKEVKSIVNRRKLILPPANSPDAAVWSGKAKPDKAKVPTVSAKADGHKVAKKETKKFKAAVREAKGNKIKAAKKLKKEAIKEIKKGLKRR